MLHVRSVKTRRNQEILHVRKVETCLKDTTTTQEGKHMQSNLGRTLHFVVAVTLWYFLKTCHFLLEFVYKDEILEMLSGSKRKQEGSRVLMVTCFL